jgi:hypothetical protein
MNTKHIKMFEGFSTENYEQEIANSIFESWKKNNHGSIFSRLYNKINEADDPDDPEDQEEESDWLDDEALSSGEMAALKRDFQVISRPQLAALYLKALGQHTYGEVERLRGRRRREELINEDVYVTGIPGIEYFCNEDVRTGRLFIGPSALSDAIGLESLGTVTRTVKKFILLLNGERGGSPDEILYKKIIKAYDYLVVQQVEVVQNIAAEGIKDPETSTRHRSLLKSSGVSKEDSILLGKSIHSLFKDYMANPFFKKDVCKVQNITINKISTDRRIPVTELLNYYKIYLMNQKILDKFNWCDLYKKYAY